MTEVMEGLIRALCIGIGATLVMDAWLFLLKQLGVPALNFAFIGRWIGHMPQGRCAHPGIAKSAPIRHELLLGWLTHYATGIAFAMLLLGLVGSDWARQPTLLPAVLLGLGTVAAPLLIMQPALGAGIASSKTPTPLKNCLRSVANHFVFGLGLYFSALVTSALI